jgi:hypothetical protein
MKLSMIVTQGLFLVGERTGDRLLKNPRVMTLMDEGKKMQLTPLPGLPPQVTFPDSSMRYIVPEREKPMYELYAQVTSPKVDPNTRN